MVSKPKTHTKTLTLRYPYTGDLYCAEGQHRIRVERAGRDDLWGYFDGDGRWLEGPLRWADPPFCRYMSSGWVTAMRSEHGRDHEC
jgi:hypothetical protein